MSKQTSQRVIEKQKGYNALKFRFEKELKSEIDLLGLKARQGIVLHLKTRQGTDKKTTENQKYNDSSHSDENNTSIHAKRNIEYEDNEKNDLEKIIALHEQYICLVKSLMMARCRARN